MKTIGVLGGISAQATMDFELRLHRAAQRIIPPNANSGYPPLLVYYHRRPPFVMADPITPAFPLQADPDLLQVARWLGEKADFLVITANGPHMVQAQIEQAASCKVLSMVETTLDEVQERKWQKVGVLGFGDPRVGVYTRPLSQMGLATETIDGDMQEPINAAVLKVMEGREDAESTQALKLAIANLRARGVDGVILGCTELPLLLHEAADKGDFINPIDLLAEAAVKFALD